MDKQTLSNYGWVVIVTLILAVMLALATPFGTYVGDAVVSVANGFVGTSTEAIDEDNIKTNSGKWEDKLNADPLIHKGIIPEGGQYLRFDNYTVENDGKLASTAYTGGSEFPDTPQTGDMYVYGDYIYRYDVVNYSGTAMGVNWNGWSVRVQTDSKSSYGDILKSINNKPITVMMGTFTNCTKLVDASNIKIPETVCQAVMAFRGCTMLEKAPVIPKLIPQNGNIILDQMFENCTSLKEITLNVTPTGYGSMLRGSGVTTIKGTCDETIKSNILPK